MLAMADKDNRHGPFSRVLSKHAGRAKERILQNFGKADRTTDEDFDVFVKNFTRQQAGVTRLQKEFRNYHQCVKAMQVARRSLMETVCELYEPCWMGLTSVMTKAEMLNQNYEEFCEKINEKVLLPVSTYAAQFPEINNKISKRNRKLLDYDNSRHNYENLDSMKKREESKITKAKEQFEEKRGLFEVINSELHEELPTLYDSRVNFFVSHLHCLFLAEAEFHTRDSVLLVEINSILEKLEQSKKESDDNSSLPALEFPSTNQTSSNASAATLPKFDEAGPPVNSAIVSDSIQEYALKKTEETTANEVLEKNCEDTNQEKDGYSSGSASGSCVFSTPPTTTARNIGPDITAELGSTETETQEKSSKLQSNLGSGDETTAKYQILHQVKSTYGYVAEDADELSFNVGDIIDVIPFEDPDDKEEGWLLGILNGVKGLFPANFTTQI